MTVPVPESVSVNFCIPMLVVVEEEDGLAKGVLVLLERIVLRKLVLSIQLGFLVMLLLIFGPHWEKRLGDLYYEWKKKILSIDSCSGTITYSKGSLDFWQLTKFRLMVFLCVLTQIWEQALLQRLPTQCFERAERAERITAITKGTEMYKMVL